MICLFCRNLVGLKQTNCKCGAGIYWNSNFIAHFIFIIDSYHFHILNDKFYAPYKAMFFLSPNDSIAEEYAYKKYFINFLPPIDPDNIGDSVKKIINKYLSVKAFI